MSASTAQPIVLSQKLVDEGAQRLATFAVVLAIAIVMWHVVLRLAQPQMAAVIDDPVNRLSALVAVLMAIALVALQRYTASSHRARCSASAWCSRSPSPSRLPWSRPRGRSIPPLPLLGLSAIGPWIVFVGAFIPSRPNVRLGVALAAATTLARGLLDQRDALRLRHRVVAAGVDLAGDELSDGGARVRRGTPARTAPLQSATRRKTSAAIDCCADRRRRDGRGLAREPQDARAPGRHQAGRRLDAGRQETVRASVFTARPTRLPGCSRRTPSTSTISARHRTGGCTTSWSCSTASACRRWSRRSARSRHRASSPFCGRSAARSRKPTNRDRAPRSEAVERDDLPGGAGATTS